MRRRGFRVGICAAVLLSACTSSASAPGQVSSAPVHRSPSPTTTSPGNAFVRTCASSVSGVVSERSWRQSVFAGPLAIVWVRPAARAPASQFGKTAQGYPTGKYLVVVKLNHTVTLSVPSSERGRVSLLYDPSAFTPAGPVSAGEHTVTFAACMRQSQEWAAGTQFNGGIIVAGAQCITLQVTDSQHSFERRLRIPFGEGTCS